jgi:hypothetical protein
MVYGGFTAPLAVTAEARMIYSVGTGGMSK